MLWRMWVGSYMVFGGVVGKASSGEPFPWAL